MLAPFILRAREWFWTPKQAKGFAEVRRMRLDHSSKCLQRELNNTVMDRIMVSSWGPLLCAWNPAQQYVFRSQPHWAWRRKHKVLVPYQTFASPELGWPSLNTALQPPIHPAGEETRRRKQILSHFSFRLLFSGFVLPFLSTRSWLSPALLKALLFRNTTEWASYNVKFDLRLLILWKESLS